MKSWRNRAATCMSSSRVIETTDEEHSHDAQTSGPPVVMVSWAIERHTPDHVVSPSNILTVASRAEPSIPTTSKAMSADVCPTRSSIGWL